MTAVFSAINIASQRLGKMTGQIVTVDGGLHEAFLRWCRRGGCNSISGKKLIR